MRRTVTDITTDVKVPLSGAEELVAVRVAERRQELAQHSPSSVALASKAISAMGRKANGSSPSLRCDRQVRFRLMQFSGEKALPIEDLSAMGEESEFGREVVIEGLGVLLAAWGYKLEAIKAEPSTVAEAMARVSEGAGQLVAATARFLGNDGKIDADEAVVLDKEAFEQEEKLAEFRATIREQVSPRVDKFLRGGTR